MSDIATSIGNSLDRNGAGGMRSPLAMGGNPIQNMLPGSNPTDAATVAQASAGGVPVGTVIDFAGTVAPTGYLFCAGQAVSRTTYADLFAAIGLYYGAGDGSATFNIPDCRGRVSAGQDNMNGVPAGRLTDFAATSVGAAGGSDKITLSEAQMPAHDHGITDPGHGHAYNQMLTGVGGQSGSGLQNTTTGTGQSTTGIIILDAGGGQAHSNVQPTIIFGKAIKAVK